MCAASPLSVHSVESGFYVRETGKKLIAGANGIGDGFWLQASLMAESSSRLQMVVRFGVDFLCRYAQLALFPDE